MPAGGASGDDSDGEDAGVPVPRLQRPEGEGAPPSLHSRFHVAVERTRASKDISAAAARETSTRDKLLLYAYYKQARMGPCTRPKPRKWEVIKKAKWEAWRNLGDMPREEAMQRYIAMLLSVVSKLPESHEVAAFTQQVTEQPETPTGSVNGVGGSILEDSSTDDLGPDQTPAPAIRVSLGDETAGVAQGSPLARHAEQPGSHAPLANADADAIALPHDADTEVAPSLSAIRRTIRHRSMRRRTMQQPDDFDALFTRVSGAFGQLEQPPATAAENGGDQARTMSLAKRLFSQDDETQPEQQQEPGTADGGVHRTSGGAGRPSSVWTPGPSATLPPELRGPEHLLPRPTTSNPSTNVSHHGLHHDATIGGRHGEGGDPVVGGDAATVGLETRKHEAPEGAAPVVGVTERRQLAGRRGDGGQSGGQSGTDNDSVATSDSSALSSEEGGAAERRRPRRRRKLPPTPGQRRPAREPQSRLAHEGTVRDTERGSVLDRPHSDASARQSPPPAAAPVAPNVGATAEAVLAGANTGSTETDAELLAQMRSNIDVILRASARIESGEADSPDSSAATASTTDADTRGDTAAGATTAAGDADQSAVLYRFRSHREHYLGELQRHSAVLGSETDATSADTPGEANNGGGDEGSDAGVRGGAGDHSAKAAESKAHLAGLCAAASTIGVDVTHLSDLFLSGLPPPAAVAPQFAKLTYLDVSFGAVGSLAALVHFPALDTLIADQASLRAITDMPLLPSLTTLSLNKNMITDLSVLLRDAREKIKGLTYLSLLGNPCCPAQSAEPRARKMYSEKIAAFLPGLVYLDGHRIATERRSKNLATAAETESLAKEFHASVVGGGLRGTDQKASTARSVQRRYSTRRALWGTAAAGTAADPRTAEQERVRRMLSGDELSTTDPLLQLAQEKVSTGLLSSHEYLHIATVHKAVSNGEQFDDDDDDDDDEHESDDPDSMDEDGQPRHDRRELEERVPRGSFFGSLLETGYRFLRSTRSTDPLPEDEEDGQEREGLHGGAAARPRPPPLVEPDEMHMPAPDATLLMKSAEAKLRAGVITQAEYDHIVKVHSKAAVESPQPETTEEPPAPTTPQGRCAAVRLSKRPRPQLYGTSVNRDVDGVAPVAVKVTADEHVVVTLADPRTRISVGDRILAANNTVIDPSEIVALLASGSGPLKLDMLRQASGSP